jgi:hypothetical protein
VEKLKIEASRNGGEITFDEGTTEEYEEPAKPTGL